MRCARLTHSLFFLSPRLQPDPKLLFKASRDGFRSKDFTDRCSEKGATLTLIKVSESHNTLLALRASESG
jgi:hypothetical protein